MKKSERKPKSETGKRGSRGATLVEYALLVLLVMGACVFAVTQIGTSTTDALNNQTVINALQN